MNSDSDYQQAKHEETISSIEIPKMFVTKTALAKILGEELSSTGGRRGLRDTSVRKISLLPDEWKKCQHLALDMKKEFEIAPSAGQVAGTLFRIFLSATENPSDAPL